MQLIGSDSDFCFFCGLTKREHEKVQSMSMLDLIPKGGFKAFPSCKECQCYPEGRNDCPDHKECRKRLGYE